MQIKVNGTPIIASPSELKVTLLDLDDADSTVRTSDGRLNRDRVRVIRQVEIGWNALTSIQIKQILDAMENVFFDFTFPDPKAGDYITRRMYVGDRPSPVAFERNGVLWWKDLKFILTEQ